VSGGISCSLLYRKFNQCRPAPGCIFSPGKPKFKPDVPAAANRGQNGYGK